MSRAGKPRITLYGTRRCPHCRQLRQWLKQRGLQYREFDIERNARAFREFQRLGGRGVPVTLIDGHRVDGFDLRKLQRLLP